MSQSEDRVIAVNRDTIICTIVCSGQIRAARGFVGWSQSKLASRANLSLVTIKRLESGDAMLHEARPDTITAIVNAFEAAGITFRSAPARNAYAVQINLKN